MPYDRSRPTGPPDPGQSPGPNRPWRPYRPQDDAGIAALTRSADRARIVTTTAILAAAVAAGLLVPRSAAAEPAAPPAHPVAARAVYVDAAVLDAGDDGAVPAGTQAPPAAPAPEVSEPADPAPPAGGPISTPPASPPAEPSTAPAEPAPPTGAASAPSEAEKAQRKAERKAQRKAKRKAERKAERKAQRKAERKAQRKAERKAQRKAARKAAKKAQRSSGDVTMTGAVRSSRAARERVSLADWRASDHARMIVWRESNGRCDVVSSNGLWRGCWQMTMTLWRGFGGLAYASSPDRASCAEQDKVAYRVWLSSWWGPWGG